jgi:glycosyltransferase involved in cell wall biosynthesis
MAISTPQRVGYVLKTYPRFSETFIVNEILAHEAAGLEIEIFSLRLPAEGRFHEAVSRVRARVTYLREKSPKGEEFWQAIVETGESAPEGWRVMSDAGDESAADVYQAMLLARKARARGISHLHAHFGTVATTVARLASRFSGLPYSFTAHAKDIFHESVEPDDLRGKLRDAGAVITVSDYNLRYLREAYGEDAARAYRVYNGLDLEQFSYSSPAKRRALIVAVGRLVEKKGFADLIDACAVLARRGHVFCCDIIGDGPLRAELQSQIQRHGLAGSVILRGPRSQEEVIQRIRKAAVFAAPCVVSADGDRDGLPTVLLETMALGTPCVSTDVTGIPEVLRDGRTGLMVSQHDPAALAEALERLLNDGALRELLAREARRLAEEQFDIRRNTSEMREILLSVAAGDVINQHAQETA